MEILVLYSGWYNGGYTAEDIITNYLGQNYTRQNIKQTCMSIPSKVIGDREIYYANGDHWRIAKIGPDCGAFHNQWKEVVQAKVDLVYIGTGSQDDEILKQIHEIQDDDPLTFKHLKVSFREEDVALQNAQIFTEETIHKYIEPAIKDSLTPGIIYFTLPTISDIKWNAKER